MLWSRTLSLYILRQVVQYTLLGVLAVVVVLGGRELVRVLDLLKGAGFQLWDLVTLVRLLVTVILVYALPVSFLFGALLTMGRLASDAEITAMRSCGIGVMGIAAPVAIMGLGLSLLNAELTLEVEPMGRREMASIVRQILVRGASVEPGRFNTIGERTFYVDAREDENRLRGVVISDRSDPERPYVVFSEAGQIALDAEAAKLTLRLERGSLHLIPREGEEERYSRLSFDRLEYEIDVTEMLGPSRGHRAREMSREELIATIESIRSGTAGALREDPPRYAAHLHGRYAQSLAPLLFALVGVPLGMRRRRGARSLGVILCAVITLVYYQLEFFAEQMAGDGVVDSRLAVWLPNVLFVAVGVALLLRERRSL